MADLDAELLALAGDDSDDGETKQSPNNVQSESPRPIKVATGARKSPKKNNREDSKEEGEASSGGSTPNTLQSASMSESQSGASTPSVGSEGHIFPLENKYYSRRDRRKITALPESHREEILAERAQILDDNLQNVQLRRLLNTHGHAGAKKRKASSADLDETQRKSSRQKTTLGGRKVGERSGPLEEYKRQREQRGIEIEQRKRDGGKSGGRRGRGSHGGSSGTNTEGSSEVEWDNKPRRGHPPSVSPPNRDQQPADLKDFNRVKVGRSNFAKVCFDPGFEHAIVNCFGRISVDKEAGSDDNVYRMAQIKRFVEDKPYAMEAPNGTSFVTNQYAVLAIGKSEKQYPFIFFSDSDLTEAEFERYKKTLLAEQVTIATKPFLNSKVDDINRLIEHRFTNQDINDKLARKKALMSRFTDADRHEWTLRRKDAILFKNEAEVARCDAELAALAVPKPKLAFGTSLYKEDPNPGPKPLTEQDKLAILNRNNRKANSRDVREAQIRERKARAVAAAAVACGEALPDHFARVKTIAKTHYDAYAKPATLAPKKKEGGSDRSRAGTPGSVGGKSTPTEKVPPPVSTRCLTEDEIFASMDFGIEIEL